MAAGELIVKEGEPVDSVFLIVSGDADVRHVTLTDNGTRTNIESIATLKPGDAIGLAETGFYSISGRRTATVVANTDMVLFQLSVAAFRGFALAYPRVSAVMRKQAENFFSSN